MNLKREGVKSGVPDLCLPVARGGLHGLYVEMKRQGGKISENQTEWIKNLRDQGYRVTIAYTCEEAIDAIVQYLRLSKEQTD